MLKKRLRVLIAKFGEGYEQAMLNLAHACFEAGFEVVYTDLRDPEPIVATAMQEAVDHIGVTTLPGARVEDFERLFDLMEEQGILHVRVTAGGFLDEEGVKKIKELGVLDFYPKGSIYLKMEQWSREFGETTQPVQYHQKSR